MEANVFITNEMIARKRKRRKRIGPGRPAQFPACEDMLCIGLFQSSCLQRVASNAPVVASPISIIFKCRKASRLGEMHREFGLVQWILQTIQNHRPGQNKQKTPAIGSADPSDPKVSYFFDLRPPSQWRPARPQVWTISSSFYVLL